MSCQDRRRKGKGRYFSDDGYEMEVIDRVERTKWNGHYNPRVLAFGGFAMPIYYKIKIGFQGRECVKIRGHKFEAR